MLRAKYKHKNKEAYFDKYLLMLSNLVKNDGLADTHVVAILYLIMEVRSNSTS